MTDLYQIKAQMRKEHRILKTRKFFRNKSVVIGAAVLLIMLALAVLVPVIDASGAAKKERTLIQGELPSPLSPPSGCVFRTRCPYAKPICAEQCPEKKDVGGGHHVMCHLYDE